MYADLYLCYNGNISEVNRTVKCIAHTYFFFTIGLCDGATTNCRPEPRLMVFTDFAQCDSILTGDGNVRMSP